MRRKRRLFIKGPPLLMGRTDVAAAYSLRGLNSVYTGAWVRIRRSSDSAQSDFGGGIQSPQAVWAAISVFIGTGSGLVTKWYDQSGNGRDLAQATTTAQPQVGLLSNGLPGMTFNGSSNALQTASFTVSQPVSFNIVFRRVTSPAGSTYIFDGLTAAQMILYDSGVQGQNALYAGSAASPADGGTPMPLGTRGAVGGVYNGASSRLEENASSIASFTGSPGAQGMNGLTVGATGALATFTNVEIQELIFFNTAHSQAQLQSDNAAMRKAWGF